MAIGSDGLGWIDFDDYDAGADDRDRRARADPVRGRPDGRPVRDPPGAADGDLAGRRRDDRDRGRHRPGGRAGCSTSRRSRACCSARCSPSTDGAAIFALLRGSTLERRLASTLEAESGLNDPMAVLLVLGFIAWIQEPGYGLADMAWLLVRQIGIGLAVGRGGRHGGRRGAAARAPGHRRPVPGRDARRRGARVRRGGHAPRLGLPRRLHRRPVLGTSRIPAQRTVTSFHQGLAWVAQVVAVPLARPARVPERPRQRRRAGDGARARRSCSSRGRSRLWLATALADYSTAEQILSVGRAARGGPGRARDVPGDRRGQGERRALQHRVLRRADLDGAPGGDVRAARRAPRGHDREPALPRPLAEAGTIRALGAEVLEFPVGASDAIAGYRVRDLGLPREAVVNVIVRGERGDPAARLDAAARRRRAAPAGAVGERGRGRPADAALARRAGRAAAAASAHPARRGDRVQRPAVPQAWTATCAAARGSAARRWSRSCASAATRRARSSRSPTGATR